MNVEASAASQIRTTCPRVTDAAPHGVVVCYKSRRPGLEASGHNVNMLNPGLRADLGDSAAVDSLVVTVVPRDTPPGARVSACSSRSAGANTPSP